MATMVPTEFDTIAAISTPPGEGAISIVRLSGEDAVKIANKVFKGKNLEKVPTHTIITDILLILKLMKNLMK